MLPIAAARHASMILAVLVLGLVVSTPEPASAQWRELTRESPRAEVKRFMEQINATRFTVREGSLLEDTIRISVRAAGWMSVEQIADQTPVSFEHEEGYIAPFPHAVMNYVPKDEGAEYGYTDLKIVVAPRGQDGVDVGLFVRRPDSKHFGVGEAVSGVRTDIAGDRYPITMREEVKGLTTSVVPTYIFVGTQEPVDEDDHPIWADLIITEVDE